MSLIQIGEYIDRNQAEPFVKIYLLCLAQGYQLSCPVNKNRGELFNTWSKILSKYREDFSDEFCLEVTSHWFNLLNQCDNNSTQIEMELFKAAGISDDEIRESRRQNVKTNISKNTESEIPTPDSSKMNKVDSLTKPEISESYKQRQLAENVSLPELEKLKSVHLKAIKSKNVNQFLISHLTFAKYKIEKEVPKSTVPQVIREKWESIILAEFNIMPDDMFLAELTNEWFYLVNQRGIPLKINDVEELLMTFLTKQQKNKGASKKPKDQSILGKLFGG